MILGPRRFVGGKFLVHLPSPSTPQASVTAKPKIPIFTVNKDNADYTSSTEKFLRHMSVPSMC